MLELVTWSRLTAYDCTIELPDSLTPGSYDFLCPTKRHQNAPRRGQVPKHQHAKHNRSSNNNLNAISYFDMTARIAAPASNKIIVAMAFWLNLDMFFTTRFFNWQNDHRSWDQYTKRHETTQLEAAGECRFSQPGATGGATARLGPV